jgi:hypothetical protein
MKNEDVIEMFNRKPQEHKDDVNTLDKFFIKIFRDALLCNLKKAKTTGQYKRTFERMINLYGAMIMEQEQSPEIYVKVKKWI